MVPLPRSNSNASMAEDFLNDDLIDGPSPPSYVDSQSTARAASTRRLARAPGRALNNDVPRSVSPVSEGVSNQDESVPGTGRLVIAIDYGTTFTGIAFTTSNSGHADLTKIGVLQDWTRTMSNRQKVPSVISYASSEPQWGSDIDEDAVTMVNTKLELDPRDSRLDELDLTLYVLRGTGYLAFEHIKKIGSNPAFTYRKPQQIVADYLAKVWKCARSTVNTDQLAVMRRPVDLVITVPVDWSYLAYDSIFKAVRAAGFNKNNLPTLEDTILVTEAEAASYFTARDLQTRGIESLEQDECFVLCDAGGGTVDTITYRVKAVQPHSQLEKVTQATGDKCGASLIDTAFKEWLRKAIGVNKYAEIDPVNAHQPRISPNNSETAVMRTIIREFRIRKEAFSGIQQAEVKIDLPQPLNTLNIADRVRDGELIISWREMKSLMDTCVNRVIKLIRNQIEKVDQGRRIKALLLVGGFGASPYLREELEKSMARKRIRVHRPNADKSLTAVVQGATIYGIEKGLQHGVNYMAAVRKSYGVVVGEGQFEWLVQKGDLLLPGEGLSKKSRQFWVEGSSMVSGGFAVYEYIYNDSNLPQQWSTSRNEVKKANSVMDDLSQHAGAAQQRDSLVGPLNWWFVICADRLKAELQLNGKRVGGCTITVEGDRAVDSRNSNEWWREGGE